jgi:hypothetical protein
LVAKHLKTLLIQVFMQLLQGLINAGVVRFGEQANGGEQAHNV